MDEVMALVNEAILQLLGLALSIIVTLVGYRLEKWVKSKENAVKFKQLEDYAYLTVQAMELAYHHLGGSQKYDRAKSRIVAWANENKIPTTEYEVDTLIEGLVKRMKDEGKEIKGAYEQTLEGEI